MPPKPRPIGLKPPVDAKTKEQEDKKAMPPPPNPPPPLGILEAEMNELSVCLKNAAIKTGQVFKFYSDIHKLGIEQYAPHPPHSITSALGHEMEKYDQMCDTIEAHLLRAIAVLERDLSREKRRIKEAEEAAAALQAQSQTKVPTPEPPPLDLEGPTDGIQPPTSSPNVPSRGPTPMARRHSTISLSSLQRSPFPLKLDLSSDTLRLKPEDVSMFQSGLASPVTLAPKSARPVGPEFTAELMAAFASSAAANTAGRPVDIDLTVSDAEGAPEAGADLATIGNSADKPIELDLDAMELDMANMGDLDLFGDTAEPHSNDPTEGVFEAARMADNDNAKRIKSEDKFDIAILDALEGNDGGNQGQMFAALAANSGDQNPSNSSEAQQAGATSQNVSEPSADRILEGFTSSNLGVLETPGSNDQNLGGSESQFDLMSGLDLSQLGAADFMNLDGFLSMSGPPEGNTSSDIMDLTK